MNIYWSWKKLPEFQQYTKKEYRQVVRQVGLKPFRHWQVWAALLLASLLMLLGLETLYGIFVSDKSSDEGLHIVFYLIGLAVVILLPRLLYRLAYLQFLRLYIEQASFVTAESRKQRFVKNSAIAFVPFALFIVGMFGLDWAINLYDEDPSPRATALMAWTEPIPENENGYFALAGMETPVGTTPFEAGRKWVEATNTAVGKSTKEYPKTPAGLKYVAYVVKSNPQEGSAKSKKQQPQTRFCVSGKQACWNVVRVERSEVMAWLAANNELLNRYQALQKYPRWENTLLGGLETPIPSYAVLVNGQSLLLASAMLDIEKGMVEQGLNMIAGDIRFARRILEGKDNLVGKMTSQALLKNDLALLSETLHEKPHELKPYLARMEEMVDPLSSQQISIADAVWLEEKQMAFGFLHNDQLSDYHVKKNATVNLVIEDVERRIKRLAVNDVNMTQPINFKDDAEFSMGIMDWYHNQGGKMLVTMANMAFDGYQNKLFDLNTMNNLVRVQLTMRMNGTPSNNTYEFLRASDRTLWNPETGKPFEWDASRKQIYFVPATDSFKQANIGGVSGRLGLTL